MKRDCCLRSDGVFSIFPKKVTSVWHSLPFPSGLQAEVLPSFTPCHLGLRATDHCAQVPKQPPFLLPTSEREWHEGHMFTCFLHPNRSPLASRSSPTCPAPRSTATPGPRPLGPDKTPQTGRSHSVAQTSLSVWLLLPPHDSPGTWPCRGWPCGRSHLCGFACVAAHTHSCSSFVRLLRFPQMRLTRTPLAACKIGPFPILSQLLFSLEESHPVYRAPGSLSGHPTHIPSVPRSLHSADPKSMVNNAQH